MEYALSCTAWVKTNNVSWWILLHGKKQLHQAGYSTIMRISQDNGGIAIEEFSPKSWPKHKSVEIVIFLELLNNASVILTIMYLFFGQQFKKFSWLWSLDKILECLFDCNCDDEDFSLTHCGPVDLWWHRLGSALAQVMIVAQWQQAITWTNTDLSSKVFCGIHLRSIHKKC